MVVDVSHLAKFMRDDVRTERVHELKTWPTYWDAIERGEKTFEVRRNDRAFQTGDVVKLYRLRSDQVGSGYSYDGSEPISMSFRIGWILQGGQFGIEPGYCVFSLAPLPPPQPKG